MSALYGHAPAVALHGAPFDLDTASAARCGRGLAGTIQDLVLIALAWAIFIGVILHPGVQIVGLGACALGLLVGSVRSGLGRRPEIQPARQPRFAGQGRAANHIR
jgi:hypothetical protein